MILNSDDSEKNIISGLIENINKTNKDYQEIE